MARGDFTIFGEFPQQMGQEEHDFDVDTLKLAIIDDTTAPTSGDSGPTWADYSANEVSSAGNYTADGISLSTVTWTEITEGIYRLDADDIVIAVNIAGFTNGHWGILYNSSNGTNMAIGFVQLKTDADVAASEADGAVNINWNTLGILRTAIS